MLKSLPLLVTFGYSNLIINNLDDGPCDFSLDLDKTIDSSHAIVIVDRNEQNQFVVTKTLKRPSYKNKIIKLKSCEPDFFPSILFLSEPVDDVHLLVGSSLSVSPEHIEIATTKINLSKSACGLLERPENGNLTCTRNSCQFSCHEDFKMTGFHKKMCLSGSWKPLKPVTCEPKSTGFANCEPLLAPENGSVDCKRGKCNFSCNEGFEMSGFHSKMCLNKEWKPIKSVSCVKMKTRIDLTKNFRNCEPLLPIDNGNITCSKPGKCMYQCQSGYKLSGFHTKMCIKRAWKPIKPVTCEVVEPEVRKLKSGCEKPTLQNGIVKCLAGGNRCLFSCESDYFLHGIAENKCHKGVWQNELPQCIQKLKSGDVILKSAFQLPITKETWEKCPELIPPLNGILTCKRNECEFKCDTGFELHGWHRKTCMPGSKKWKPQKTVFCKGEL